MYKVTLHYLLKRVLETCEIFKKNLKTYQKAFTYLSFDLCVNLYEPSNRRELFRGHTLSLTLTHVEGKLISKALTHQN